MKSGGYVSVALAPAKRHCGAAVAAKKELAAESHASVEGRRRGHAVRASVLAVCGSEDGCWHDQRIQIE